MDFDRHSFIYTFTHSIISIYDLLKMFAACWSIISLVFLYFKFSKLIKLMSSLSCSFNVEKEIYNLFAIIFSHTKQKTKMPTENLSPLIWNDGATKNKFLFQVKTKTSQNEKF